MWALIFDELESSRKLLHLQKKCSWPQLQQVESWGQVLVQVLNICSWVGISVEFSFQSYRNRFSKMFLFWSFWMSLSLTHLYQAAFLLPAPSFRSVLIITWWIMHTFPLKQIIIYTKSELWKLCWLQVNRCWQVQKSCRAKSWTWEKR